MRFACNFAALLHCGQVMKIRIIGLVGLACGLFVTPMGLHAQAAQGTLDEAKIIQGIDASVTARNENLLGYTVTEHYSVYRNQDTLHPAAEMTVKTTYKRDAGKSYEIESETGSDLLRKEVLERVLDSERNMTQPANRLTALIDSENYDFKVQGTEKVQDQNCIVVGIRPKHPSPYVFNGRIWVNAEDYSIVQLEGVAAKSPSVMTGPPKVSRTYTSVEGFPMAVHASATSSSWMLGQTIITIEYNGYELQPDAAHAAGQAAPAAVTNGAPQ